MREPQPVAQRHGARGRLQHDYSALGEDLGERLVHLAARELRAGRRRLELGPRRRRLALGGLSELGEQGAQRERDISDDRIAHRRPRSLVRVTRDRHELGALGKEVAGDVGVGGEHRGARHEHEIVTG